MRCVWCTTHERNPRFFNWIFEFIFSILPFYYFIGKEISLTLSCWLHQWATAEGPVAFIFEDGVAGWVARIITSPFSRAYLVVFHIIRICYHLFMCKRESSLSLFSRVYAPNFICFVPIILVYHLHARLSTDPPWTQVHTKCDHACVCLCMQAFARRFPGDCYAG